MTKTPCPSNPLGIKGCGEAGAIAAPPAVINAITDALGHEDIADAGDAAGRLGAPCAAADDGCGRRRVARWTPDPQGAVCDRRPASSSRHDRTDDATPPTKETPMYAFAYHRPNTVRQAASLLAKDEDAKILAGGHTLLPTMKQRLAAPRR